APVAPITATRTVSMVVRVPSAPGSLRGPARPIGRSTSPGRRYSRASGPSGDRPTGASIVTTPILRPPSRAQRLPAPRRCAPVNTSAARRSIERQPARPALASAEADGGDGGEVAFLSAIVETQRAIATTNLSPGAV